jgi:outer membrane cobalamin receptor
MRPPRLPEAIALSLLALAATARGSLADEKPEENSRYESRAVAEPDDTRKKRGSAEAVSVVPTGHAKEESADLGEVLNRVPGISLARSGGLGSDVRFSLNGFSNDQVRLFLDGIPLDVAGFAFGLTSIPVPLLDRVEIYRGVVPIRFGADALGGAVNLVGERRLYGTGGSASLSLGSFSTVRGTFSVHHRDDETGLYAAGTAFFDSTKNDYDVDVSVPDSTGQLHTATVPRFHDAYRARGAFFDAGVIDRPWVKRLLLRLYYSDYQKDLQNNPIMTIPYGAAGYDESLVGGNLDASQPHAFGEATDLELLAGWSHRTTDFHDTSSAVYDWFGNVIHTRPQPGEIDGTPHDLTIFRDSIYSRIGIASRIAQHHTLRFSSSAAFDESHGISRAGLLPGAADPLAAARELWKVVSGVEYQADLFADRVENVAFVKHYYLHANSDQLLTGNVFAPLHLDENSAGGGDALRIRVWRRALLLKASYEYTTRLPASPEIFGDGILVLSNGNLVAEHSHNANLGLVLDLRATKLGSFDGEIDGFFRDSQNLIVLLGSAMSFAYQNVAAARTLGVEGTLRYRSPHDYLTVEANATWQEIRNTSSTGPYALYNGDRIPNLPYLFVNASARGNYRDFALTWYTRYVHEFFRDWESLGAPQYKQVVDAQVSHSVSLSYTLRRATTAIFAFDVDNLTNARLFDQYGAQRPGRAFYGKTTLLF